MPNHLGQSVDILRISLVPFSSRKEKTAIGLKGVLSQRTVMTFFRQYIAPLFIVFIFLVALLAVSARAFLPTDMAQPAPLEGVEVQSTLENLTPSVTRG
jgi:hypothetical protein